MKVGADSMTNEIRTHLETTSVSYFTGSRRHVGINAALVESAMLDVICVPDCVPNNRQLFSWLASSDGLVTAAPGRLHQALANLINLANQEGLRGVTVVTIQIDLREVGSCPGGFVNCLTAFNETCFLIFSALTVTSMLMMSPF